MKEPHVISFGLGQSKNSAVVASNFSAICTRSLTCTSSSRKKSFENKQTRSLQLVNGAFCVNLAEQM